MVGVSVNGCSCPATWSGGGLLGWVFPAEWVWRVIPLGDERQQLYSIIIQQRLVVSESLIIFYALLSLSLYHASLLGSSVYYNSI